MSLLRFPLIAALLALFLGGLGSSVRPNNTSEIPAAGSTAPSSPASSDATVTPPVACPPSAH